MRLIPPLVKPTMVVRKMNTLENLEVVAEDYMLKVGVSNFRNAWAGMDPDTERVDEYGLGLRESLGEAVSVVINLLGLQPCEGSWSNFISDLRGHVEQLHKEIFDLRKSLQFCMEMQVTMQHCMMQQVAGFTSHSGTESINNIRRKGTCCICHDTKVDSLLYRCSHMCTCFKCGNELQRSSGKCPICQASILDVVRTYTDYRSAIIMKKCRAC